MMKISVETKKTALADMPGHNETYPIDLFVVKKNKKNERLECKELP